MATKNKFLAKPNLATPTKLPLVKARGFFMDDATKYATIATMQVVKRPFRYCKLYDFNGDVSKRWSVAFYIWDEAAGKLVRKRDYSMNHLVDLDKRRAFCKQLMKQINTRLVSGYVLNPKVEPKQKPVTVAEAFATVYAVKQSTNRKGSVKEWKILENVFLPWLQGRQLLDIPVAELTASDLAPFFDYLATERKVSNTTYNNYITRISIFFNALVTREIIERSPMKGFRRLQQTEKSNVPYDAEEIQTVKAILQDKKPFVWLAIQFIYYCFVRPNELIQLKVRHIHGRTLYIPAEVSKTRRDRHVPIHPALMEELLKHEVHRRGQHAYIISPTKNGSEPCAEKTLYNTFKYHCRHHIKPGQDLYSFKHSGVISAYTATKDIKAIQQYCGHVNIAETDIYLRRLGLIRPDSQLDCTPSI